MGYAGDLLIVVIICSVLWFLMINATLVNNRALLLLDRERVGGRERETEKGRERERERERGREGERGRKETRRGDDLASSLPPSPSV